MTDLKWTIQWADGDAPNPEQESVEFHRLGQGWFATVTLERNGHAYAVDIVVDGEMRAVIPMLDSDGKWDMESYDIVRYSDSLMRYAATDAELDDFRAEWEALGREIFDNTPWFDLYDTETGDHLDVVTFTVSDAVQAAKEQALAMSYPSL